MPNATVQSIILKDFTGGIWWNEGEPPNNTYSPFIENLDPLPGGGYQKRQPCRLNYNIAASRELVRFGSMTPMMVQDPTNASQYAIVDQLTGTFKFRLFGTSSSTPVYDTTITTSTGTCLTFASSDAGANWYVHGGYGGGNHTRIVNSSGVATAVTAGFNDNLAAPANGKWVDSDIGCVHLAAYYFHGHTRESAVIYPNRIRWSHPGRFEDYRTNDRLDIGDSAAVVGLYSVQETLLIVKENSMWVLTGYDPDTFQVRKIADFPQSNSQAASAITMAGTSHPQHGAYVFVAGVGVLHWDGSKLKNVTGGMLDAARDGRLTVRTMAIINDVLYCSEFPIAGAADYQNSPTWEYHIRDDFWARHYGIGFTALCPVKLTATGTPAAYALHYLGSSGGYSFSWYRQYKAAGSWCDNQYGSDSNIVCTYRSPWQDARNPARKKRWVRPWLVANKRPNASASDPVTYGVVVYRDWDGVNQSKTASVSATKATNTNSYDTNYAYGHGTDGSDFDEGLKMPSIGTAYSCQLTITSAGTPKDQWGFDSLTFKYIPRSLK